MKKTIFLVASSAMILSCGQPPEANVEKIDLCTIVGDNGGKVQQVERH